MAERPRVPRRKQSDIDEQIRRSQEELHRESPDLNPAVPKGPNLFQRAKALIESRIEERRIRRNPPPRVSGAKVIGTRKNHNPIV